MLKGMKQGEKTQRSSNYTGILQYTDSCIKVKTKEKVVSIEGARLVICVITDGYMQIEGKIDSVRWI